MWRLKYLIYGMIPSVLLGIALYFVAPAITDAFRDAVRDSAVKTVQTTFEREVPTKVAPGKLVITEDELLRAVENADTRDRSWNISGMSVVIENGRVSFVEGNGSGSTDNAIIASSVPKVVDGRIVLTDRSGVLSIFKPARDAIADEIENQLALLFSNSGVRPVSVTADNGQLIITTEAIGGTSTSTSTTAAKTPTTPAPKPTMTPTTSSGLTGNPFSKTPTPTP